jgi:hypothetical protein
MKLLALATALIISVFGARPAYAAVAPMAVVDAGCIQNPRDPYDLGWRIAPDAPQVPNQCLNSAVVRPAKVLKREDGIWQITNFYHQGHYWSAQIHAHDIESVAMMTKRIARDVQLIHVIHLQTRFYFHHGVQLFDAATGQSGPLLRSAVVSWEPAFPVGEQYEYVTTMFRNLPIVGRLISVEEPLAAQVAGALSSETEAVQEFPLPIATEVAWTLFEKHLQLSEERQMTLAYILLRRNCATTFFDILDAALAETGWPHPGPRFRTGWSLDPVFGPAMEALRARQLLVR